MKKLSHEGNFPISQLSVRINFVWRSKISKSLRIQFK